MPKRAKDYQPPIAIDAGDVEVFHPKCRTRILITQLAVERNNSRLWLSVEGICAKCDCYVRLRMTASGLE